MTRVTESWPILGMPGGVLNLLAVAGSGAHVRGAVCEAASGTAHFYTRGVR